MMVPRRRARNRSSSKYGRGRDLSLSVRATLRIARTGIRAARLSRRRPCGVGPRRFSEFAGGGAGVDGKIARKQPSSIGVIARAPANSARVTTGRLPGE